MNYDTLYDNLRKDVAKANRKLAAIEKYTGKPYTWSGRKLYDTLSVPKLSAWSDSNRITINKNMSENDLLRVKSAVDTFLNSKTSTVAQIKKRAAGIKESFETGINVSSEQAEHIYQAFEDDVIKWAVRYLDASELWTFLETAKETKMAKKEFDEEFIKRAEIAAGNIDADFRDNMRKLYSKEVKGKK